MNLTDKGTKTAKLSAPDRIIYADKYLIHGPDDITAYMKGVCYDAAAYMRYLYNAKITYEQLASISAQNWLPLFNFAKGRKWDGQSSLPGGKAIGFCRVTGMQFFHAAIAVGGTEIRAINGGLLGAGWLHPVDLRKVLNQKNPDGSFKYDGTNIFVYISDL